MNRSPSEVYTIEIEQGGHLSAEAHPEGTQEFLTVFMGELTVRVEDQEYRVGKDDAIRFRADRPHAYHNSGAGVGEGQPGDPLYAVSWLISVRRERNIAGCFQIRSWMVVKKQTTEKYGDSRVPPSFTAKMKDCMSPAETQISFYSAIDDNDLFSDLYL